MSKRIVQFSHLGNFGRFGNQLFQYIFARAYAEKYDATLEIPHWIGEKIFKNVSHPPISKHLPRIGVDKIEWGRVNVDLYGYFQTKECFDILSESKIREWLIFLKRFDPFLQFNDKVASHLRLGDYITLYAENFCVVGKQSFLDAFKEFGVGIEQVAWCSEEKPRTAFELEDVCYSKMPNSMYGVEFYKDEGFSFLSDFFVMINSKILFRSNSSFSFWAGFFQNREVYCPVVKGKVGEQDVSFIKGNHSAICNVTDDIVFGA